MKASPSERVVTWTTGQVVLATLFVVCVFLTFWLLYRLRDVLFLFFVAIVLGTAIRPAVDWLHRRGIPRATGVILLYIVIASLVIGFLAMILPLLADQATEIFRTLPEYYTGFRSALVDSHNRLLQNIGLRLPSQLAFLMNRDPNAEEVVGQVGQTLLYTNLIFRGLLGTLVVFLLAYYWTQEGNFILRSFLRIAPPQRKKNIREFLQLAEMKLGGYVRGQGLLCLAVGATAFIAYLLIGLPYLLVLAIFAGVMEMVPIFGPALGAVPALLVALSIDPSKAIWVVVATVVIQLLENTVLVPRIMKHSLGVNPIITLLSLIAFGSVFGFMGALLALPLAAILQLLVSRVMLTSAENARKAQEKAVQIQSLIKDSQDLMQTLHETSNQNPSFRNLPEADRLELYEITEELNQFLKQVKEEGEAA
ncbi:MAG TPA: AI-2E family transporter [Anaerolineales bacterium]|jgi:predicted PurR-regulated permease PerM|nr:AI-2E family transporter [Anaerolineales bacterium]